MLFHVRMDVRVPHGVDPAWLDELKRTERERAQALQSQGKWRHLWRIAGQYSNISVFDVADAQELHDLVSTLPLFPFMDIQVTPLCRHPSSVREDDS
ncbi:MAG: muconolactone Delta-isomerase [Caulobacteraceae bacterium]|nr:muconolactone Delta-isomerase [Caulobacteraceae bacterium]